MLNEVKQLARPRWKVTNEAAKMLHFFQHDDTFFPVLG